MALTKQRRSIAVASCLLVALVVLSSQTATAALDPIAVSQQHRPHLAASLRDWWLVRRQRRKTARILAASSPVGTTSSILLANNVTSSTLQDDEVIKKVEETCKEHEDIDSIVPTGADEVERTTDSVDKDLRLPLTPWQRLFPARKRGIVVDEAKEGKTLEKESVVDAVENRELTDRVLDSTSGTLDAVFAEAEEHNHTATTTDMKLNDGREDVYSRSGKDIIASAELQPRRPTIVTSGLALPSSISIASLRSTLKSILHHPQLPKWTLTGMQVGLVLYLLNGIWKAAVEVMDELDLNSGSPHLLKMDQVRQIVKDIYENKDLSSSAVLEQQPTLQYLTKTLLASGMPLQSDETNSIERVLMSLTRSEASILQQCLYTSPKPTSFRDICGLHTIKQSLLDLVWTVKNHENNGHPYSHLVEHPPGILLYGPPGCGKTLLVKALASAAQLPCLVVTPSVLLRKYVGETNQQVRSLFSLAQKLSPCIVCIDELDGLFRERSMAEHEVSRDLKTEFLQWWDGIASDGNILIIGATNRPFDVDSAVLRRMPQSYFVGLPNYEARRSLLSFLLSSIPISGDVSLHPLAAETEGYTPSDLKQIVRMAITMGPLREARFSQQYRPLANKDIGLARTIVTPTPLTPGYRAALTEYAQRHNVAPATTSTQTNPWDSFYNAGTIHASHGTTLPEQWSEDEDDGGGTDNTDYTQNEYYDEHDESDSDDGYDE